MNVPSPVGNTLVSGDGAVLSHIVSSDPIDPGSKLLTVTLIILDSSIQVLAPRVDVTTLLYHVSWVNAPDVYVSLVARGISVKIVPSVLLFHWYVKVPSPVGVTLPKTKGIPLSHIV